MSEKPSLIRIAKRLRDETSRLHFGPPVHHVYNPLTYAWSPHCEYLERFGEGEHKVLIIGMNPSYFGMAQTGIPFGDVDMVRDWLAIRARVHRPRSEHPKRPIEGFGCRRREMSGKRLWEWARDRFGTPDRFFAHFFVLNYCPLCFLTKSGANLPVEKLRDEQCNMLFSACDRALNAAATVLGARYAMGLGRFAERRVHTVLGRAMVCGGAPHPSPANARVGAAWGTEMARALAAIGVELPATSEA